MASYLCVKMNNSVTKSYNIKSSANKPYLRVGTGFIPLTTATATGPKVMVRAGGVNYRLADFITTSTATTTGTSYITRAKTTSTSYITASRASTSSTGYQTRMSTSATTYYTRMSTSATTYATRASTSKTDYAYKTNTTNTIYNGKYNCRSSGESTSSNLSSALGTEIINTYNGRYVNVTVGFSYDNSIYRNKSSSWTATEKVTTTTRYTFSKTTITKTNSITTSIYHNKQYICNNCYESINSISFTLNGSSSSIIFSNRKYNDSVERTNFNTFGIEEEKKITYFSGFSVSSSNASIIISLVSRYESFNYFHESYIYSTKISTTNNVNIDLQIKYSKDISASSQTNFIVLDSREHTIRTPLDNGSYTSTALNGNISRNATITYTSIGVGQTSNYVNTVKYAYTGSNIIHIATIEQFFIFKNFNLTNISNNFYNSNRVLLPFHGSYSTSTVTSTYQTTTTFHDSDIATATCSKLVSSVIYNGMEVSYKLLKYLDTHSNTSYETNRSVTNTIYSTRSSTSNTGYKTRSSTSATSYLTRSSTSNTTYATRSSQYTSNTSYLTKSETYQTSYITTSTSTTIEG